MTDDFDDTDDDLPTDGSVQVATDGVTIHSQDEPGEAAAALVATFDEQWCLALIYEIKRQVFIARARLLPNRPQVGDAVE